MPKVLFIIAQENFRDVELLAPKEVLEGKGITVEVASITTNTARGADGVMVDPNIAVKDVNLDDYDFIGVIGGPGALELYDYNEVKELLTKRAGSGKPFGAICIAPTILARLGLLNGKKATTWDSNGQQVAVLQQNGAEYVEEPVVVDGNLITANGPGAAKEFAEKIAELIG
ncbi:DJ-1/PfpI family protein [Nanoarchaeota archaeon]